MPRSGFCLSPWAPGMTRVRPGGRCSTSVWLLHRGSHPHPRIESGERRAGAGAGGRVSLKGEGERAGISHKEFDPGPSWSRPGQVDERDVRGTPHRFRPRTPESASPLGEGEEGRIQLRECVNAGWWGWVRGRRAGQRPAPTQDWDGGAGWFAAVLRSGSARTGRRLKRKRPV